jgi:hypothetical protein
MNTQSLKVYLIWGIIGLSALLAGLMPVKAQSDPQVQVTVPFEFTVGDERLPAGDYSLRRHPTTPGVLVLTDRDDSSSFMFSAHFSGRLATQGPARLVFDRYDDLYFLRQVWMTGAQSYDLPKTRAERSIEKELGQDDIRRVEVVEITDNPK